MWDKSLTGFREIIAEDIVLIEAERADGSNGRSIHSLYDYTSHDLVLAARAASERGHRVELVVHDGAVFWGLARSDARSRTVPLMRVRQISDEDWQRRARQ